MSVPSETHALWIEAPRQASLRVEPLPALGPGQVLVEATHGAISRGTESLVFHASVPENMHASMRCPHQQGELSLPVKYGYCSVGQVLDGDEALVGQRVFCLHPHQEHYVVASTAVVVLPEQLPSQRAVLGANMETAVNALWDARPAVGSRIAVIGAGAVGILLATLVQQIPGVDLEVLDVSPTKADLCQRLGLRCVLPEDARAECDWVFHASGHPSGLARALELSGVEGHVVELSWYGDKSVPLALGGPFHNRRLRITSSQVGMVSDSMRARWSYARRMGLALELLARTPSLDALLSRAVHFADLPRELPALLGPSSDIVTQLIEYGPARSRR